MKKNSSMFSSSDSACLTFHMKLNPQVDKEENLTRILSSYILQ